MTDFANKNLSRRSHRPERGTRERRLWNAARARRRLLPHGAFGNLREPKSMDQYVELAHGTRGGQ